MSKYFTADPHFSLESMLIIHRENRPYKSPDAMCKDFLAKWNKQMRGDSDAELFVIGDWVLYYNEENTDYDLQLAMVKELNARVTLVLGNSEDRLISHEFKDYHDFKDYCLHIGFDDVMQDGYIKLGNEYVFVTHRPCNHDPKVFNLFGHVHRNTGLYKPFGLNVGVDCNNFMLWTEDDIAQYREQQVRFLDNDIDILS